MSTIEKEDPQAKMDLFSSFTTKQKIAVGFV